jgi:hypothetical protein
MPSTFSEINKLDKKDISYDVISRACEEKTLAQAIVYACLYEHDRILSHIKRSNVAIKPCFKELINIVIDKYISKNSSENSNKKDDINAVACYLSSLASTATIASEETPNKIQALMWVGMETKLKIAQKMVNAIPCK